MKLCECKVGMLVAVKPEKLDVDETRLGWIVGFQFNATKEVIPTVQFVGNVEPTGFHHSGLDVFTAW